jgi:hypothetical protein
MSSSADDWDEMVRFLHQKKLTGLFQFTLDAGSPIRILIAQSLYLLSPFFSTKKLTKFAEIFENNDESYEFLKFLRSQE